MWLANPALANLDGLLDYGEDFTDSATVIENLQTAYQVGKGMTEHVLEMVRQAEAEAEQQRAAPEADKLISGEATDDLEAAQAVGGTNQKRQHDRAERSDGIEPSKSMALACKKKGINFLSTPFDEDSVNYLKKLVPFFKIASADINNYPLLKSVAKTYKPVLISTGASKISFLNLSFKSELSKLLYKSINEFIST